MPTVTVPRANVTVDDVCAVLRKELGSRYMITPAVTSHFHMESAGDAGSILVKRHWFEQASIEVVLGPDSTELRIGSAANFTPGGLIINRATIVPRVRKALEHAPELAGS
jgi:hypothetical protein